MVNAQLTNARLAHDATRAKRAAEGWHRAGTGLAPGKGTALAHGRLRTEPATGVPGAALSAWRLGRRRSARSQEVTGGRWRSREVAGGRGRWRVAAVTRRLPASPTPT